MEIGDKLFCIAKRNNKQSEVTVIKVGRIYFKVKELPYTKFSKETLQDKSEVGCGYNYQLYLTKQNYLDELLKNDLISKIQKDIYFFKE